MPEIVIFGGTRDSRALIENLLYYDARLTVSVATAYGAALLPEARHLTIREGRLDAKAMQDWLTGLKCALVVDATHPYAEEASRNIRAACEALALPYLRLTRQSILREEDGVVLPDAKAAARYLAERQGDVLLTVGSKELPTFAGESGLRERLYARVLPVPEAIRQCEACGIPPGRRIAVQGPFDEAFNAALLKTTGAAFLVTKDTGREGGYEAKIAAARGLGVKVVIIGRPQAETGVTVEALTQEIVERLGLRPLPPQVTLLGMGMEGTNTLTREASLAIERADCLLGAERMLRMLPASATANRYSVYAPEAIAETIASLPACRRFAVLLSGDTGFFSGAQKIRERLLRTGIDEIRILPGISSLSYFCARIGRTWEDVHPVSLHGRDADLVRSLARHEAVFALLGGADGAKKALQMLLGAGLGNARAHIGERLGYAEERIASGTVAELLTGSYDPLCVLLVERPQGAARPPVFGIPDAAFLRGKVPMTKMEVRAILLAKLRLTANACFYDVGAGTGSVSVEAARCCAEGDVYAIERAPEAVALIEENQKRFRLTNLHCVHGAAPAALADLPSPTHAFIGGSGGETEAIIRALLARNPSVRIVATAVTLETVSALTEIAKRFDSWDVVQAAITTASPAGAHTLMRAANPIWIFTMQNGGEEVAFC